MPSEDFSARMQRVIQKREAGTITLHGAEQYEFHRPSHGRAVPVERAGRATLHLYPLTMLLSLALGAGAVGAVAVGMFRIVGQPATMRMSDMDLAWTIGLGLALAMVLQSVLRLKSAGHTVMLLVGVVAMAIGQHNLHHWFPEVTAQIFSTASSPRGTASADGLRLGSPEAARGQFGGRFIAQTPRGNGGRGRD